MSIATVREAIHERLDPVIEEIVTREISQRGGGYARAGQEEGGSFQALMPVLLSTIMQRRQAGAAQHLETILPVLLPTLMQRRQIGAEQASPIQAILPLLLSSIVSRRQEQEGAPIQAILPLLLSSIATQRPEQEGTPIQAILPLLLSSVVSRGQAGQEQGQELPLQTLAPVLVAALSAR